MPSPTDGVDVLDYSIRRLGAPDLLDIQLIDAMNYWLSSGKSIPDFREEMMRTTAEGKATAEGFVAVSQEGEVVGYVFGHMDAMGHVYSAGMCPEFAERKDVVGDLITAFEERLLARDNVPIKQVYSLAAPHEKKMFESAGYQAVRKTPSGDYEMERCIEQTPGLISMRAVNELKEAIGPGGMYVEDMSVYQKCLPGPPERKLLC